MSEQSSFPGVNALDVACTYCTAAPGEMCNASKPMTNEEKAKWHMDSHRKRWRAASHRMGKLRKERTT